MAERKLTKAQLAARKWKREMAVQVSLRHKAIHAFDLGQRWGKSKSYIPKVIADLILMDGEIIGSSHDGYFPVRNKQERELAVGWMRRSGFTRLLRCAVLLCFIFRFSD